MQVIDGGLLGLFSGLNHKPPQKWTNILNNIENKGFEKVVIWLSIYGNNGVF